MGKKMGAGMQGSGFAKLIAQMTNGNAFADPNANGGRATFGDHLQGIANSMNAHHKGVPAKGKGPPQVPIEKLLPAIFNPQTIFNPHAVPLTGGGRPERPWGLM